MPEVNGANGITNTSAGTSGTAAPATATPSMEELNKTYANLLTTRKQVGSNKIITDGKTGMEIGTDPGVTATAKYVIEPTTTAAPSTPSSTNPTAPAAPPATPAEATPAPASPPSPASPPPEPPKPTIGGKIIEGIGQVISFPAKAVGTIASGLIDGVKSGFNAVKEATKPIWKPIENFFKGIFHKK